MLKLERLNSKMDETIMNDCKSSEIDISGLMQLQSGDTEIKSSNSSCGSIRQEIEMRDPT